MPTTDGTNPRYSRLYDLPFLDMSETPYNDFYEVQRRGDWRTPVHTTASTSCDNIYATVSDSLRAVTTATDSAVRAFADLTGGSTNPSLFDMRQAIETLGWSTEDRTCAVTRRDEKTGKFKVGDIVRMKDSQKALKLRKENSGCYPKLLTIGTIIEIKGDSGNPRVQWHKGSTSGNDRWWIYADCVEKVGD